MPSTAAPVPDYAAALRLARAAVAEFSDQHRFVIVEDRTVERPFGWVFFYLPERYLRTRDPGDLVPGVAPFVVHRSDGSIAELPSSLPPERAIELYEQRWRDARATAGRDGSAAP
jgi:hypothetical protein